MEGEGEKLGQGECQRGEGEGRRGEKRGRRESQRGEEEKRGEEGWGCRGQGGKKKTP